MTTKLISSFKRPALCLLAAGAASAQSTRPIATGWDSPNAARFRARLAAFEQWGVFDGTTIAPTRRLE
jgi:hypothetical protein